jgi:hypothetical protein
LRPSVLDTFINCLMMACDTHERGLIEGMVKAIVTEYNPGRHAEGPMPAPASAPASVPAVATQAPIAAPQERLALIKKFVPFRI